jgi:hypothetical protein
MRSGQEFGWWGVEPDLASHQHGRDRHDGWDRNGGWRRGDRRRRNHGRNASRAMIADGDARLCSPVVTGVGDMRDRDARSDRLIEARDVVSDANEQINKRKEHQHRTAQTVRLLDRQTLIGRAFHSTIITNIACEHYHRRAEIHVQSGFSRDRLPHVRLPYAREPASIHGEAFWPMSNAALQNRNTILDGSERTVSHHGAHSARPH